METKSTFNTPFYKAAFVIIAAGMLAKIYLSGIAFGHWLYAFMH